MINNPQKSYDEYLSHIEIYNNDKDEFLSLMKKFIVSSNAPDEYFKRLDDKYLVGYYNPSDSFQTLQNNLKNNYNQLAEYGWVKDKSVKQIEYKISTDGWRSKHFSEIQDKDIIVGIGCSITYGTGLNQEDLWIHKLANRLDCEYINCAIPAVSSFLQSLYVTEYILENFDNIKGVFLYQPPPGRLDLLTFQEIEDTDKPITERNLCLIGMHRFITEFLESNKKPTNYELKILLGIFYTSYFHSIQNNILLKNVCKNKNTPYHFLDSSMFKISARARDKARDLMHDGERYHTKIANKFFKMYMINEKI